MEKFSSTALIARLQEIEAEHLGSPVDDADNKRESVVYSIKRFQSSRFDLGKALNEYKRLFIEERGWMVAAQAIAEAMKCDERTVRNIIRDYQQADKLPAQVLEAAKSLKVDLGKRKYLAAIKTAVAESPDVARIDAETAKQLVSNVLEMPKREQDQDNKLTPEEKELRQIRLKIRTALTNIEPDQKLSKLIEALEFEMHDVWGEKEPVVVTITPRPSSITIDGKRREVAA